ncbi:uncharacterized protein BDZ99DRAFT_389364 [Mytilinidion resinicola]|uniref:Zn(2)-C6 fungal-type domain-containing protein n=1 Tax=Mytilinidion resinicola TaxID=574789 RepID=A0A6A6YJQ0_9PEZI|nr:uncharacterized protein BDZ99DRAFT_389364 [Mytilinidion resinicola]KAF2809020.1 hypothetical protein BDZ99DRAFT_389364 [Mytilinidion resinicola]
MKCDEQKPICGPCAKGGRQCVYGAKSDRSARKSVTGHWQQEQSPPPEDEESRRVPKDLSSSQSKQIPDIHSPETVRRSIDQGSWNDANTTSPQSNFSGSAGYGVEVAPLRWFGLLADDAANGADDGSLAFLHENFSQGSPSINESLRDDARSPTYPASAYSAGTPSLRFAHVTPTSVLRSIPQAGDGRESWQSPIKLRDREIPIFRRFVDNLSLWIDMYDPMKHFSTFVPQLALQNEGLMKAILALSSRHLSIKPMEPGGPLLDRTAAVQYYYETLQYLQRAMKHESYTRSLELIATALIVSTYEMIDGAGKGWERHLKGVFWIQRSQDINGETGGLKQAVWWAWLRQDLWAAFREGRRAFSFFKPTKPYHVMEQYDIASRVVYLLVQAVNYSSAEECKIGEASLRPRIERADALLAALEEWRGNLSVHFNPLPLESGSENAVFKPIWINPPAFAVSIQLYSFARILLLVHRPAPGGFLEYAERSKQLVDAIDAISGIASTLTEEAACVVSTQCLFGAGLYTQEQSKREAILHMIEEHQARTGWPVNSLGEELAGEWRKGDGRMG